MNVMTIGGATQDIFLSYRQSTTMSLNHKNQVSHFTLFESGEKKELSSIQYDTGGGATNTAVAFSRLGFNASCFCNTGNDEASNTILQKLKQENIDTTYIQSTDKEKTGQSFIIATPEGESTVFAYRGSNRLLPIEKLSIDTLSKFNQLYITSLSHEASLSLLHICKYAKTKNIPIAINPGISQLARGTHVLKEALEYIDILILNSAEAQIFMHALTNVNPCYKKNLSSQYLTESIGINQKSDQPYLLETPLTYADYHFSIQLFFKELCNMGPKIGVITNGSNGVYVGTSQEIIFAPSINVPITSTIGCGDAFGSCFVGSLRMGYSIPQALLHGIINSSSVITHLNAKDGLLSHEQLKDLSITHQKHPIITTSL